MPQHRFRTQLQQEANMMPGFMMAPAALLPEMHLWQRDLYTWAYEQARAVVEPSWVERDVLGVWN